MLNPGPMRLKKIQSPAGAQARQGEQRPASAPSDPAPRPAEARAVSTRARAGRVEKPTLVTAARVRPSGENAPGAANPSDPGGGATTRSRPRARSPRCSADPSTQATAEPRAATAVSGMVAARASRLPSHPVRGFHTTSPPTGPATWTSTPPATPANGRCPSGKVPTPSPDP